MQFNVFVEPHERAEAIEAYGDWLSANDIFAINDAPEDAPIQLVRTCCGTRVVVLEKVK